MDGYTLTKQPTVRSVSESDALNRLLLQPRHHSRAMRLVEAGHTRIIGKVPVQSGLLAARYK